MKHQDHAPDKDLFSANPLFLALSHEELATLSRLATPVEFIVSENMPFKNENGTYVFYMIRSGHAKLAYQTHTEHPVRICGPGDILGYGEWNFKSPHKAEGLDNLKAWRFNQKEFQDFLHVSPRLQEIMIKVLCNILALKDERIAALENHSVRNRVASVLLSLSDKFGKMTYQGQLIDVKIDRDTMAKLAGTVTESLSRQLSELEAEDIIHREGRFIYIKNKAKIEERARN